MTCYLSLKTTYQPLIHFQLLENQGTSFFIQKSKFQLKTNTTRTPLESSIISFLSLKHHLIT